jgi:hypothetical protein
MTADVELSDEMFIITKETADAYLIARAEPPLPGTKQRPLVPPTAIDNPQVDIEPPPSTAFGLAWNGDIPPLKWVNFYMKVLPEFVSVSGLNLNVKVEFQPKGGVSQQTLDEMKSALRELGLNDNVSSK